MLRGSQGLCALLLMTTALCAQGVVRWAEVGSLARQELGASLAAASDLNGDGFVDLLVGDRSNSAASPDVLLLSGRDGSVLRTHSAASQTFGRTVAAIGDITGDGVPDYAIADEEASLGGQVYFYSGLDGQRVRTQVQARPSARFGRAIVGLGDWDGDGFADYAISSPSWDDTGNGITGAGAVSVYSGATSQVLRVFTGTTAGAGVGFALAAIDDVDQDGKRELAVSGSATDRSGRVTILYSAGGSLTINSGLPVATPGVGIFGAALANAGDVDGDHAGDLVVETSSTVATEVNRIAVYSGLNGTVLRVMDVPNPRASFLVTGDVFSVGDWDADGIFEIGLARKISAPAGPGFTIVSLRDMSTLAELQDPDLVSGIGGARGVILGRPEEGARALAISGPGYRFTTTAGARNNTGRVNCFELGERPGSVISTTASGTAFSDLVLLSGNPAEGLTAADSKAVTLGRSISLRIESPDLTHVGRPVFLVQSLSVPTTTVPGFPELWVDVLQPFSWVQLAGDPILASAFNGFYFPLDPLTGFLPSAGLNLEIQAALLDPYFSLNVGAIALQAFVLDPTHPRGIVTTSAHEFRFVDDRIYVDASAAPGGNGTRTAPFRLLIDAYAEAQQSGATQILIATGAYSMPNLPIRESISFLGGYDPQTWTSQPGVRSLIQVPAEGFQLANIASPMTLSRLEIRAGGNMQPGGASIALKITDCANFVSVQDCEIESGQGGRGIDGADGTVPGVPGAAGDDGSWGYPILAGFQPDNAGAGGGTTAGRGGNGGRGMGFEWAQLPSVPAPVGFGNNNGFDGAGISPGRGGSGGSFFTCSPAPNSGSTGGAGAPGLPGSQGQPVGTGRGLLLPGTATWVASVAGNGGPGAGGSGGGGGGGGASTMCPVAILPSVLGVCGGGGGGGGQGGAGGTPGSGGSGGGASFAVYLVNSSPDMRGSILRSGPGGLGGAGGDGQPGGLGGLGGNGGLSLTVTAAAAGLGINVQSGAGGSGGNGGNGGGGGAGASGDGGPSAAVVLIGTSAPVQLQSRNTLIPGSGGLAGFLGRSGDNRVGLSGVNGMSVAVLSLP